MEDVLVHGLGIGGIILMLIVITMVLMHLLVLGAF